MTTPLDFTRARLRVTVAMGLALIVINAHRAPGQTKSDGSHAPSLAGMPMAVREEVERLMSNDPGKRATAAATLGAMGRAAAPAIPWLVAAVGDGRPVISLSSAHAEVGDFAIQALEKIGPPAISYLLGVFKEASSNSLQWWRASGTLARLKNKELLEAFVVKFRELLDQASGNPDPSIEAYSQALTCYADPRVGDLLLDAAAKHKGRSFALSNFEKFVDRQMQSFNNADDARAWYSANRSKVTFVTASPACQPFVVNGAREDYSNIKR